MCLRATAYNSSWRESLEVGSDEETKTQSVEEATLVVRNVGLEVISEGEPRLRTLGKDLDQGERYGLMA